MNGRIMHVQLHSLAFGTEAGMSMTKEVMRG